MQEKNKNAMEHKKIGFTCGAFDLLHCGHVVMFREAKENCDHLVVGLQTDPSKDREEKNKPIQSLFERHMQLSAIKYIDEIIPYDSELSLLDLLQTFPIDIRFVGEEYKSKSFTGRGLHEIYYTSRKHSFSTTQLRFRVNERKRTES